MKKWVGLAFFFYVFGIACTFSAAYLAVDLKHALTLCLVLTAFLCFFGFIAALIEASIEHEIEMRKRK